MLTQDNSEEEYAMACAPKGMKKGGKISADMISPRKALGMGMTMNKSMGNTKKMKKGGRVSAKCC